VSSTSLHELKFERNRSREADAPPRKGSDCETISLLGFLEEENRKLRRAVIELALETLLLRSSLPGGGC
jgi:hypothetical protein